MALLNVEPPAEQSFGIQDIVRRSALIAKWMAAAAAPPASKILYISTYRSLSIQLVININRGSQYYSDVIDQMDFELYIYIFFFSERNQISRAFQCSIEVSDKTMGYTLSV